jgi:class 3 adenylate cyclase
MFVDLRGFTTLCEGMTPGETYAFINEYLSRIEPAITENGGFIQHFLGDGILALFCRQSSADDASRAALGMLAAVEHFNDDRQTAGLPPIAIGIGMNTGALMLGTIGGRERLDANVIGDAVNLAARVEGQTKHLGAVLMTETTHAGLADATRFALREVDRVVVKGRSAAVSLFELTPSPRTTADLFAEGLAALRRGDLATARLRFEGCLDEDRADLAAAVHLQRCRTFEAQGLPENWDGVLRLDAK